jgi:hypothetical protein
MILTSSVFEITHYSYAGEFRSCLAADSSEGAGAGRRSQGGWCIQRALAYCFARERRANSLAHLAASYGDGDGETAASATKASTSESTVCFHPANSNSNSDGQDEAALLVQERMRRLSVFPASRPPTSQGAGSGNEKEDVRVGGARGAVVVGAGSGAKYEWRRAGPSSDAGAAFSPLSLCVDEAAYARLLRDSAGSSDYNHVVLIIITLPHDTTA